MDLKSIRTMPLVAVLVLAALPIVSCTAPAGGAGATPSGDQPVVPAPATDVPDVPSAAPGASQPTTDYDY